MVEKIFRIFGKIFCMALLAMKKMEVETPKKAQDTTKMYNRGEFIQRINDITSGKVKLEKSDAKGTKTYKVKDKNGNDIEMSKDEFESFVKRRGGKIN
tara:strand:+ start:342 stop:635 length:294 start_codon:yes stop_codon:yes gene_type:complete